MHNLPVANQSVRLMVFAFSKFKQREKSSLPIQFLLFWLRVHCSWLLLLFSIGLETSIVKRNISTPLRDCLFPWQSFELRWSSFHSHPGGYIQSTLILNTLHLPPLMPPLVISHLIH